MQKTSRFRSTTRLDLEFSLYLVSCLALFFIVTFLGAAILAQVEGIYTAKELLIIMIHDLEGNKCVSPEIDLMS